MIRIAIDSKECMPTKTHKWDAGWDIKSNNETFTLHPGDKVKVHTGVSIEIPVRHMGLIVPRSGLGSKYRVGLANTAGVIDSEYRGEITVSLVNDGDEDLVITQYDRFCQLIVVPVNMNQLRVVDRLTDTSRGAGGYGSTGLSDIENPCADILSRGDFKGTEEEMLDEELLEWTEEQ